jgi:hypothetical protein
MPGCSARPHAPFNAASIQTLRMASSFALYSNDRAARRRKSNYRLKSVLAKWPGIPLLVDFVAKVFLHD